MSFVVTSFESTPNPNAIKVVLDRSPTDVPRSYFRADQASEDALASALFEIDGVTNVLIHLGWITVGRDPRRDWASIKAGIERVLRHAAR
ncbi:MAG: NifU N-terminal domain-containing protein [Phycisphaerales bacterium]|nr:NifU N-terminal domain-containing protein [Phycisphaerales bacterium]